MMRVMRTHKYELCCRFAHPLWPNEQAKPQPDELVLGRLVHVDENGTPFVTVDGQAAGVSESAHSTVDVGANDVGRQVVIKYLCGTSASPVILGFLRVNESSQTPWSRPSTVRIEGQRVVIAAEQGVELTCPRARVVLDRRGTVQIRGEDISSWATKNHKLKGGNIRLN